MTVELKKQPKVEVYCGDVLEVLKTLPSESVNCCVTSPPYFGLRDYGVDGQIGLEETPDQYINKLVGVFRKVKRVLRRDGTVWVNIADSYAGSGKGRNGDGVHSAGGKQATNKRHYRRAPAKDARRSRREAKRPDWHPVDAGLCPSCRWLVLTERKHLAQAQSDDRKHERSSHEGA